MLKIKIYAAQRFPKSGVRVIFGENGVFYTGYSDGYFFNDDLNRLLYQHTERN